MCSRWCVFVYFGIQETCSIRAFVVHGMSQKHYEINKLHIVLQSTWNIVPSLQASGKIGKTLEICLFTSLILREREREREVFFLGHIHWVQSVLWIEYMAKTQPLGYQLSSVDIYSAFVTILCIIVVPISSFENKRLTMEVADNSNLLYQG